MGVAQALIVLSGGGMLMLGGSLTMVFSVTNDAVAVELGAADTAKGALMSMVFVGMLFGTVIGGVMSDMVGRRLPFLCSILGATLATMVSATSRGLQALLIWRTCIGFFWGCSVPPWNAIAGEMTPAKTRIEIAAVAMLLYAVGAAYTAGALHMLQVPAEKLAWRELTIGFATQGFAVFALSYFALPESLRYLDYRGSRERAVSTLRWMRSFNGRPEVDVDVWRSSEPEVGDGFAPVFSRSLLTTTLTMCFMTFFLNLSYYGVVYALPQVLPSMDSGGSPFATLMVVSIVEVLGFVVSIPLCHKVTRRCALLIYLIGVGLATAAFIAVDCLLRSEGFSASASPLTMLLLVRLPVSASRLFQSLGWTVVYVYVTEVYPTSCRAFGGSVAVAVGRFGGIMAPLFFEWLLVVTGRATGFFVVLLIMAMLNVLFVEMLPVETKDRQLGDISEEARSLKLPSQK